MTQMNSNKVKRTDESLRKVMANLTAAAAQIKTTSIAGLIECAILVRRDMEKADPKTPVDTGNLRHSFFITTVKGNTTSSGSFKGENATELEAEHQTTMAEASAKVAGIKYPVLIMGYSANYALWVHEAIDAQFSGRAKKPKGRPGSGAKWFEFALNRNTPQMLTILGKEMKI